jgi:hypothetical protein
MNEQQLIEQRQQQLAQVYDPQEQFILQQKAALPGMFEGQRSSLQQAQVNAFRDIGTQAQRQGMFFSGFKPAEQARYLGEKFLPGMQDISARQETARLGLLEQLIGLRGQRAGEMTKFQEQLRQEALQRQQQEIQRQEQERDRQLQMEMQRRQISAQRASAPQQDPYAGYTIKRKVDNAGMSFRGPGDRPISMAQYAQGTGVGITELLRQSQSKYDQKALADIQRLQGQGWTETNIENFLRARYKALF